MWWGKLKTIVSKQDPTRQLGAKQWDSFSAIDLAQINHLYCNGPDGNYVCLGFFSIVDNGDKIIFLFILQCCLVSLLSKF